MCLFVFFGTDNTTNCTFAAQFIYSERMGIVIRQSIKSVIVTLAGVVLGGIITIMSPRFFPKAELGFTQNLIKIALLVSYLGLFGFNYTLLIYGQKYPPGHKARGTFLTITGIVPLVFSLLVCSGYFTLKERIIASYQSNDEILMRQYFVLFPLLTFCSFLISWLEGYLQSLHKTALQNFAREILSRIIYITLIILFALQVISFAVFIWLYVLFYLVPFLFLLIISLRNQGFRFEYKTGLFSGKEIREIFRFSGYHMLTVVSTVLIIQADSILLAPLDKNGFEAVAVYGVASMVIAMLRNPTRVIGIAATPAFTQSYNEGNIKELKDLFSRSAINMQIIAAGMFALVYLNIDNIQGAMSLVQKGYEEIKALILILMVGQLVDMFSGLNFELIGVTKYYRFNFWIAVFLLVVVFVLNYFLIQRIGIYGAAWATSIGLAVFNILKTIFLWKKMRMQPFNFATLKVLAAGALAFGVAWLLPFLFNVFADGIIRSIVFCGLFWFFLFMLKISGELNEITLNIIRKRRLY
jgi:O-antigen/teichoic acid export membrane protein